MTAAARHTKIVRDRLDSLSAPSTPGGCRIWIGAKTKKGYGSFHYKGKTTQAHRVSWIENNGPIQDGMCVLHKCDVPGCINPSHLFLGSQIENLKDMRAKKRHANGNKIYGSKLTEEDVFNIRSSSETANTLSVRYKVGLSSISAIRSRTTWKHL